MSRELPLCLTKGPRLNIVSGASQHRTPKGLEQLNEEPDNYKKPFYNKVTGLWEFLYVPEQTCLEVKSRYQVGDRLYLQEQYQIRTSTGIGDDIYSCVVWGQYSDDKQEFNMIQLTEREWKLFCARKFPYRKTSGRMMYKSLARHWFEVEGVKAELLQDISEKDARAEGLEFVRLVAGGGWMGVPNGAVWSVAKWAFQELWDSIYGEGAWDRNDWVWCYTLRKIDYA